VSCASDLTWFSPLRRVPNSPSSPAQAEGPDRNLINLKNKCLLSGTGHSSKRLAQTVPMFGYWLGNRSTKRGCPTLQGNKPTRGGAHGGHEKRPRSRARHRFAGDSLSNSRRC